MPSGCLGRHTRHTPRRLLHIGPFRRLLLEMRRAGRGWILPFLAWFVGSSPLLAFIRVPFSCCLTASYQFSRMARSGIRAGSQTRDAARFSLRASVCLIMASAVAEALQDGGRLRRFLAMPLSLWPPWPCFCVCVTPSAQQQGSAMFRGVFCPLTPRTKELQVVEFQGYGACGWLASTRPRPLSSA